MNDFISYYENMPDLVEKDAHIELDKILKYSIPAAGELRYQHLEAICFVVDASPWAKLPQEMKERLSKRLMELWDRENPDSTEALLSVILGYEIDDLKSHLLELRDSGSITQEIADIVTDAEKEF